MNHAFNLQLANQYGVNVSIFVQSLAYWIHYNLINTPKNIIDGYCWSYNSAEALRETFTYWSKKQMETVIKNSVEAGLVIKGNYNKSKYDRTCWYALTPEAYRFFPELCQEHFIKRIIASISQNGEMESVKWINLLCENGKPIPNTNPPSKAVNKDLKNTISENQVIEEIKTVYHEELPELPKVRTVDSKLRVQLKRMVKDWPSYQKDNLEFTLESFRNYLRVIKENYPWFIKTYETATGNVVKCSLRKLTREVNIAKIVNGEFSTGYSEGVE